MRHFDLGKSFKFETPGTYSIRVLGHMDKSSSGFLGGRCITTSMEEGQTPVTELVGRLMDQAELNGVLNSLYELHLTILSVELLIIE